MKLTEGISEICGAIIGDGWIQSNESGLFITGNMVEDKLYYDNCIVPLINKELNLNLKAKPFPYWRTYGISIYKKSIIRMFLNLGLPKGNKAKIAHIPTSFKRKKEFFISVLRGIFDTDGSIYFMKDPNKQNSLHARPRIRITSISKKLIEDIKDLSEKLGIKHSNPSPGKWSGSPNSNYIFEINRIDSISKWLNIVKTNNPAHQTNIRIWNKFGFCPPMTNLEARTKILNGLIDPLFYKINKNAGVA